MFKRIYTLFVLAFMTVGQLVYAAEGQPADPAKTGDLLDKVAAYTKQFYEAALPVVKKAYEIGLLTLKVDAAADIGGGLLAVIWAGIGFYIFFRTLKWDMTEGKKSYAHDTGFPTMLVGTAVGLGCIPPLVIWGSNLISLWVWVKLFHPDLWLAHAAIEKLVH